MTAMLIAGVAGYGASYLVRGVGGVRWFSGYAVVLIADAVGRLAVAAPLLLIASPHLAAAAVAAAGGIGAVAPFVWARRWCPELRGGEARAPFDARGALRFAAPASVVASADQLLINGAPLLVIVLGTGGTAEAGVVFAATMLVRAPVSPGLPPRSCRTSRFFGRQCGENCLRSSVVRFGFCSWQAL